MKSLALLFVLVVALIVPAVADAKSRVAYPMKGDDFKALIEKRIERVRRAVDRKLESRGVSVVRKKEILATFDSLAKDVRGELAKVTADGTVTRDEGKKVQSLAAGVRGKLRARLKAQKRGDASPPQRRGT